MEHLIKLDNKKIKAMKYNELEIYWNRSKSFTIQKLKLKSTKL